MARGVLLCVCLLATAVLVLWLSGPSAAGPEDAPSAGQGTDPAWACNPYASNNGNRLPPSWTGPRYRLNHSYPPKPVPQPPNPPWRAALGGKPIGPGNAIAYVQALKDHIAPSVQTLVDDYTCWDPAAAGWFDQPWIALKVPGKKPTDPLSWPGREPIQGTYAGPGFGRWYYGVPIQEYVAVYYNRTAAHTLYRIWQENGSPYDPDLSAAQFDEGAIVVKLALTAVVPAGGVVPKGLPQLSGSARSKIFVPPPADPDSPTAAPEFVEVQVMQFDLIVKDSKTAPETGWVFATLVYDKDHAGKTTWERMVPLGAMWGNDPEVAAVDPEVNVGRFPNQKLRQNVINPAAPAFAKITLGYGGRLSGPNDAGAVLTPDKSKPGALTYFRMSSCMSCHGTGEYPGTANLVPMTATGPLEPGSKAWLAYFQSRPGTRPQTPGTTALDYDMVTRQALINRYAHTGDAEHVERAARQHAYLRKRGH